MKAQRSKGILDVSASGNPLQIDIPVKPWEVKTVFSIDALAFEGGSARFAFPPQIIENDITDWNAKPRSSRSFTRTRVM
jgi:hypothetical protein